jgi:type 1 glutamine amidotransferase
MARNLIITGGRSHDFGDSSKGVSAILDRVGITSEITYDLDAGLKRVGAGEFDLLTIYAARWRMLSDPPETPGKEWAIEMSPENRSRITNHLKAGRGLLGLHTAPICFDDWQEWGKILGAAWKWGVSHHPPFGPAKATVLPAPHPITEGLKDFTVNDEVYSDMNVEPDVIPLMTMQSVGVDKIWPALWAREVMGGRVVYDALGHTQASFDSPTNARIVARSALWALGRPDSEVRAA